MAEPLIELKEIHKPYQMGDGLVRANDGISLTINYGEFIVIVGKSGSGKSTLMSITGVLDVPTDGEYILDGEDVSQTSNNQLAEIRNKMIGFILQQYNPLLRQNLLENAELPPLYTGVSVAGRRERAFQSLERVGLKEERENLPDQLSSDRQQRTSIARVLAGSPSLTLADEPTGALDSKISREVLDFSKQLSSESNTIVIVTHDSSIAMEVDRAVRVHDGKINSDGDVEEYGTVI